MSDPSAPQPAPPPTDNVARMLAAPSPRRSVWTARQKMVRGLWSTFGRLLWVLIPGARSGLIRLLPASRSIALCNKMALKNLDA